MCHYSDWEAVPASTEMRTILIKQVRKLKMSKSKKAKFQLKGIPAACTLMVAGLKAANDTHLQMCLDVAASLAASNAGLAKVSKADKQAARTAMANGLRANAKVKAAATRYDITSNALRVFSYHISDAAIGMLSQPKKAFKSLQGAQGASVAGAKACGRTGSTGNGKKAAKKRAARQPGSKPVTPTADSVIEITARRLGGSVATLATAIDGAQETMANDKADVETLRTAMAALLNGAQPVEGEWLRFIKNAANKHVAVTS